MQEILRKDQIITQEDLKPGQIIGILFRSGKKGFVVQIDEFNYINGAAAQPGHLGKNTYRSIPNLINGNRAFLFETNEELYAWLAKGDVSTVEEPSAYKKTEFTTVEPVDSCFEKFKNIKRDSRVDISGLSMTVCKNEQGWYLSCKSPKRNDFIFDIIGIKSKRGFVKAIVGYDPGDLGVFPFLRTLEDLKKVCGVLYYNSRPKIEIDF